MSLPVWKFRSLTITSNLNLASCIFLRNGHHMRGKPPGIAKSLEEKLTIEKYKDPSLHFRVDIGLPPSKLAKSNLQERLKVVKENRKSPELERLARNKQLFIDLEKQMADWYKESGQQHIKTIADHYGVYEHLFGDAYFYPRIPLSVMYETDDGTHPVYFGNVIKPADAKKKPTVTFEEDAKNSLWTLILTNPDGHFTENDKEYVHWFVGNIPGNNVSKGETVIEYLQPFPPKGTGFQRLIFVLYKQDGKIDFASLKKEGPCLNLIERTFSTYNFYRERQDSLTPSGLAFFQSDWDSSLKQFFHETLDMKEPIFEYDFPPPYIRPQEWFPKRRPFNIYMDKYRDPKQINKEFLMRKLKKVHPFKEPPPPLPYPNAESFKGYVPNWLKLEITKSRFKWGRINEIE